MALISKSVALRFARNGIDSPHGVGDSFETICRIHINVVPLSKLPYTGTDVRLQISRARLLFPRAGTE